MTMTYEVWSPGHLVGLWFDSMMLTWLVLAVLAR